MTKLSVWGTLNLTKFSTVYHKVLLTSLVSWTIEVWEKNRTEIKLELKKAFRVVKRLEADVAIQSFEQPIRDV